MTFALPLPLTVTNQGVCHQLHRQNSRVVVSTAVKGHPALRRTAYTDRI